MNQQIEEITIKPAYQFLRSENVYDDTLKPIEDHVKKNKKLKKVIFEFDGVKVDGYGDMDGSWGSWENEVFGDTIAKWTEDNKNLEIPLNFITSAVVGLIANLGYVLAYNSLWIDNNGNSYFDKHLLILIVLSLLALIKAKVGILPLIITLGLTGMMMKLYF